MSSPTQASRKRPPQKRVTTVSFDSQDSKHIDAILTAGWAKNSTDAVRFALKFTADRLAKEAVA